jgi:hypothetical protein
MTLIDAIAFELSRESGGASSAHRAAAHRLLAEAFRAVEQNERQPIARSDRPVRCDPPMAGVTSDHGPIAASVFHKSGLKMETKAEAGVIRVTMSSLHGSKDALPRRVSAFREPASTAAKPGSG